MNNYKKTNLNFLTVFLENRDLNYFYSRITNILSGQVEFLNGSSTISDPKNILLISDVPGYLNTELSKGSCWHLKKIDTFKGSLINLKNYKDDSDYLLKTFSSSRRSKFRTYQKRLEHCFNITYKSYYGEIDIDEYESLFNQFLELINRRFDQKQAVNDDLVRWKVYREIAYPLILKKEACLFVIYDGDKPISISFNPIHGKTIFGYIRAYDIDYGKFYIGFTDIIVQLKWCYDNNFTVFDLLKGEYEYKSQWTDTEYYFEKHVLYNSSFIIPHLKAKVLILKIKTIYQLVNILKKWNLHILKGQIISKFRRLTKYSKKINIEYKVTLDNNPKLPISSEVEKIEISDPKIAHVKMYINNFLYQNQEYIDHITVFSILNSPNTYLIKGLKNIQKIIVN
ncbi:GNAT family N-acetyltransferase [Arenibacter sp. BSSL-BM3]|uniref:GNAT family N-acetyltransferase n=1 Tax=Arenibacter arenosicollis TaxID=2762274 RepID=A0ABR7QLD3_9FLAO|nr:GNAT family N-acetyltransferase [Arenibacter arenosicollis]MBC8767854.1 GNAT family N-acetyltransferase [Arenibacter arenosicollis]